MGSGHEVESAAMEIDSGDEVGFVSEATSGVLDPLNLCIDGFTGSIGNAVLQIGDDVLEPPLIILAFSTMGRSRLR